MIRIEGESIELSTRREEFESYLKDKGYSKFWKRYIASFLNPEYFEKNRINGEIEEGLRIEKLVQMSNRQGTSKLLDYLSNYRSEKENPFENKNI